MSGNGVQDEDIRGFVGRILNLEEERGCIAADIQEVYDEAKAAGLDTKVLRKVVALRKMDKADFEEQEEIMNRYLVAMGMRP